MRKYIDFFTTIYFHKLITLAVPASLIIFKDKAMTSKLCFLFLLVLSSFVLVSPLRLPVNSVSYTKSLIGRQSSATRCFADSGFIKARGLLKGIVDVSIARDYSREINLDDAANLLRDRSYLHKITLPKKPMEMLPSAKMILQESSGRRIYS